jgi:hypothetical protein
MVFFEKGRNSSFLKSARKLAAELSTCAEICLAGRSAKCEEGVRG